jgi:CRAL/TRIO domain
VETSFTILDLKNVTLKQVASVYGYIQEASKIGQNYYPERMGNRSLNFYISNNIGRFYMINSPRGFSTVWQIIKRFLHPITVEKISILGKDYQAILLSLIPAENLPKRFGGLCECPGGCELSDAGPWQEIEYTRPLTSQTWTTKAESEESIMQEKPRDDVMDVERLAGPQVGM